MSIMLDVVVKFSVRCYILLLVLYSIFVKVLEFLIFRFLPMNIRYKERYQNTYT